MAQRGSLLQMLTSLVRKTTATNRMHNLKAYVKTSCYFRCVFDVFLDLVILAYFNANSIDVCTVKVFIYIYSV